MISRGPTNDELGTACRRLFDHLETALALLAVPPEVQCEIARRFGAQALAGCGADMSRLCVAVAKLDSGAGPVASGQRAAGAPTSARQLVYGTESADIAISVRERPGGHKLDVIGQVFPSVVPEDFAYKAVLLRGLDEAAVSSTDEFGEFTFEAVVPGEYYMLISPDASDVTIVPLHLAA